MLPIVLLAAIAWCATDTALASRSVGHSRKLNHPPPEFDHGVDLPSRRPLVIAHRGSCGSLPEHTAAAGQRAVDEGADVIECDVTVSRDLVLWCMHENWMNATTNVRDVFPPSRANSYYVADQLRVVTDYFAVDFDETEMRQIRRRQQNELRDPNYDDQFEIVTFDEFVSIAQNAGRPGLHVGVNRTCSCVSLDRVVQFWCC